MQKWGLVLRRQFGTLGAGAGLKEKREVHRTTLSGDVELKTESEVSNLNRDLSKAREITKKSKTHVRVFTPFGTAASMKELFKDMDQQFARIPAYFKPNTVEHYQTQALVEQLKAYQKEQLDNKEIQERLQDEQTLAEIAQRGNHAFVENYFTRRGRAIDKEAEMGLSQGLTPYFERGEDGERILLFAQPQHVTLEADKHGKPHLVVQLGERPKSEPSPQQQLSSSLG